MRCSHINWESVILALVLWAVPPTLPECMALDPESPQTPMAKSNSGVSASRICLIDDKRISESSGVAASILNPGALWTHNDSGDRARLFLVDMKGETRAVVSIRGASAVDWEDMASFMHDGKGYLLIADTGNNARLRSTGTLYVVRDPLINPRVSSIEPVLEMKFKYDDGRHDCEAVAVDDTSLTVLLISKGGEGECGVFELPLVPGQPNDTLTARKIATLKIPHVTAMDISPDGQRMAILTGIRIYVYVRKNGETWPQTFQGKARMIATPRCRQPEAICYDRDGTSLYVTSEGVPAPIWKINLQDTPGKP